jgi:alcohol dehydrogenase (NADP+)
MATWRELEKLVDMGLVRHIGTSNMTIPKLKLLLRRRPHQARLQRDGAASVLPAARAVQVRDGGNGIVPIGFAPIGSPTRPDRDRTADDAVDIEEPASSPSPGAWASTRLPSA